MDKNISVIYAEAVTLGYEGTLEEFLATIKGPEGVGISDVFMDSEGVLFVKLSNDSVINVGKIAGKDGIDGKNGRDGRDGIDGHDGKDGQDGAKGIDGLDGVGIENAKINENAELEITLTDGRVLVAGTVAMAGKDGKDGKDGENGNQCRGL